MLLSGGGIRVPGQEVFTFPTTRRTPSREEEGKSHSWNIKQVGGKDDEKGGALECTTATKCEVRGGTNQMSK